MKIAPTLLNQILRAIQDATRIYESNIRVTPHLAAETHTYEAIREDVCARFGVTTHDLDAALAAHL